MNKDIGKSSARKESHFNGIHVTNHMYVPSPLSNIPFMLITGM